MNAANTAPEVDAGPDLVVTLPDEATLDGTVTDDGLPAPPSVTTTWSQESGPGTVTFADVNAVDTTASFSEAGSYVLRLTADDGALAAYDETTITVNAAPTMHVGDLDGTSVPLARDRWDATVTITVHDGSHQPLADASVSGFWSDGARGGASCTTNGEGQCIVSKHNLKGTVSSATFTIQSISHATAAYIAEENHDDDGDSDGTTIVVYKDGPPANQPPVASFTYSCSDVTPACDFDASASTDSDGTIVDYVWDFGDSNTASGVAASHTYATVGTTPSSSPSPTTKLDRYRRAAGSR